MRLTPCPPVLSSLQTQRVSTDEFHWKHYSLLFFLDFLLCLLRVLGNTGKTWNSHLQYSFVKDFLTTNYLHVQLISAGFYPVSVSAMPENVEEASITISPLETWGNIGVTAVFEFKEHHYMVKGSSTLQKGKRKAQWHSGAWEIL